MSELTTERLEKRIKNCIEVGNGCVMLPVGVAEELLAYRKAAEKLVRCKGRYHSEQNYRALAALFGVTVPDLPPLLSDEAPAQPVIPERPELRYGDNVLWFLNELADFDASGIDSDDFDVYGEGRNGMEGFATISITELAADAAKLLSAQPVSNPYKLNSWISVADRLPSEFGRYLCYIEEQNDLGKSNYQWNCSWNGDVFSDAGLSGRVTHWMPLPASPAQESE